MRRGYDRVESRIGMSYDEIKGVTMSVSSLHADPLTFFFNKLWRCILIRDRTKVRKI